MSQPLILKIKKVIQETPNLKTYVFEHGLNAKPGQFVMVWMPGVDEVPMSVGWQMEKEFHVGIANAGDCTSAIFENVKPGDKLGIRGPYGTTFSLPAKAKHIILVGGGCGTPPLLSLAQKAVEKKIQVTAILGARGKDYLVYEKQFKKLGCDVHIATDDGTKGHKGFCTKVLEKIIEKTKADAIYTCGPEKMMVKVAQIAQDNGIYSEVSLERYMKCGFGICGQCCMDDSGMRVCKEGPVISGELALKHHEFGKYTRIASGLVRNLLCFFLLPFSLVFL
ncbi:MAG: dihydroorotate dehydrogenase electron transfer subunit [Candidatus Peregrinibacteria bacterium]